MMKNVTIYTDGACSGNPGPGGYAAILIYENVEKEICGYESETTNNRMELIAAIQALKSLKFPCEVMLYSDSAYMVDAFLKGWIYGWIKNNWRKSDKSEVKNIDLWKEMFAFTSQHKVIFHKVKGHSDNEFNNRCDMLATGQIKINKDKT